MAQMKSLIKLAENPHSVLQKADDDSMDYEEEESMDSTTSKAEIADLREGMGEIAKAVRILAKSQETILKGMYKDFPPMEEEDPMGAPPMPPQEDEFGGPPMGGGHGMPGEDDFGGEDDLDLDADFAGGNFAPYGQEEEDPMRGGDVTMNRTPAMMRNGKTVSGPRTKLTNAADNRISKDDASSNFGEKDSDIPGNRKLDPDNKDKNAEEYLIQGGPSAGQSVNKALLKAIQQVVRAELGGSRIAKSSESPIVGSGSKLEKAEGPSYDEMVNGAVKLSFHDLNRKRVELGDLPAGIL